jgi:hypothetical protein
VVFETFLNRDTGEAVRVSIDEMLTTYIDKMKKGGGLKIEEDKFDDFIVKIVLFSRI